MMMSSYSLILIVFILVFAALWFSQEAAVHVGLVDHPDDNRRYHGKSTPLIGGICMLFGMSIGWLLINMSLAPYRVLFITLIISTFFGILDDFHELSHKARFFVQFTVAFFIAYIGQNIVYYFGNLFFMGDIQLHMWAMPVTIFGIVGVINAVNMSDGVDGLAGFQLFVQFALLGYVAYSHNQIFDFNFLAVILASIFAFLFFNFPMGHRKALVFMGDVGSAMLAILLVWFLIKFTQSPLNIMKPVTALWIVALPLFDLISVIFRRLQQRRSPFKGDRGHFHHILLNAGLKPFYVSSLTALGAFLIGTVGVVMDAYNVSAGIMFFGFIALFICYLLMLGHLANFIFRIKTAELSSKN
jgi:UDP-GlcNAc:undecaprenyl-phosphate GlcNAc-1-phosphate transferase